MPHELSSKNIHIQFMEHEKDTMKRRHRKMEKYRL